MLRAAPAGSVRPARWCWRACLWALAPALAFAPAAAEAATSARADFNGDGYSDLAVGGAPVDSVGGQNRAEAVMVIFGSAEGLGAAGNQRFTQDTPGVAGRASPNDRFGASLAAGDINGDGHGDLVVGVPNESIAGRPNGGVVNVLYGSSGGLTTLGNRFISQNTDGVIGLVEPFDNFGHALTIGDFDGDGFADLAVGVPHEGVRGTTAAGAVNVIYGSAAGLDTRRTQLWHQDSPGVLGSTGEFDRFGFSLAAGDLDGDGRDDLAADVPLERIRRTTDAGAVNVLYGSAFGLTARRDQLWSQGAVGIRGAPERGDNFGSSLAIADFNGDGRHDNEPGAATRQLLQQKAPERVGVEARPLPRRFERAPACLSLRARSAPTALGRSSRRGRPASG